MRLHVSQMKLVIPSLSLFALIVLASCSAPKYMPEDADNYKLPHGVKNASDKTTMYLQASLNRQGIKVISIGQTYLISIPTRALFPEQSPRLIWESYALLNKVVAYMKQFRKISVSITSYSNQYFSARREQALTLARARVVSDYLQSQAVDSRFIFTQGSGSDKPIVTQTSNAEDSSNSRIEITFRDAIS